MQCQRDHREADKKVMDVAKKLQKQKLQKLMMHLQLKRDSMVAKKQQDSSKGRLSKEASYTLRIDAHDAKRRIF
jgi:hypothetical protein